MNISSVILTAVAGSSQSCIWDVINSPFQSVAPHDLQTQSEKIRRIPGIAMALLNKRKFSDPKLIMAIKRYGHLTASLNLVTNSLFCSCFVLVFSRHHFLTGITFWQHWYKMVKFVVFFVGYNQVRLKNLYSCRHL